MKAGNLVSLSWKKEQQVFEKNLAVLRKNHRKDALHDLRVAVKKLRAFLELGLLLRQEEEASPALRTKSLLKNTESLFTISGRQRDLDICLELVSSLKKETGHPFRELQFYFRSCLNKCRGWTMTGMQHFKTTELQRAGRLQEQKIQPDDPITISSKIIEMITDQIQELQRCFDKPHQLRKKLKTIYYWLQLVSPEAPVTTSLHDILDDLGDWQDLGIAGTRIKHFRQDLLPGIFEEKDHLKEAEKEIETRKKVLLKTAIAKTRKWIKSLKDL